MGIFYNELRLEWIYREDGASGTPDGRERNLGFDGFVSEADYLSERRSAWN
jgi:hypothetical protein